MINLLKPYNKPYKPYFWVSRRGPFQRGVGGTLEDEPGSPVTTVASVGLSVFRAFRV